MNPSLHMPRALALLLAIFAMNSSSVHAQAKDLPVRGGTLAFPVHLGEPNTFDCHSSSAVSAMWRLAPHYSSLLKIDASHYPEVTGDLAKTWKTSKDGLTYEFKLHPNVKFHDGSALTANDVKVSYDRMRAPPTGVVSVRQGMFEDIKSIEAPNPTTVVFHLSRRNASMLQIIAMPFACVYSAKLLASDPSYPAKKVMGSGPYRFVRYVSGAEWVGERFDGYFKSPQPYLDGFRAVSVTPATATNALIAGQVSYSIQGLTPSEVERVKNARGDEVSIVGGKQVTGLQFWFAMNTQKTPLNDVRVRRALLLAVDRWAGAKAMDQLTSLNRVGGLLRPGSTFARSEAELLKLPGYSRDIEASRREARRLLTEAGINNLKLTLVNHRAYPFFGVLVADQLRQIGVTVDHKVADSPEIAVRRQSGDYDLMFDNPLEFLDDPTVQLSYFKPFSSNPNNRSRSDDPKISALLAAQSQEMVPAKRVAIVRELEEYLLNQAYVLPMYWQRWIRGISKDVGGLDEELPSNVVKIDLADIWFRSGGQK